MSNMFKVEFAKLCYNKQQKFVSIYVTDTPLTSDADVEIKGKGNSKTFWIAAREESSNADRKMQYIYPGTSAWEKFAPFRAQFLSSDDANVCKAHD
jgi:hypothetical protein